MVRVFAPLLLLNRGYGPSLSVYRPILTGTRTTDARPRTDASTARSDGLHAATGTVRRTACIRSRKLIRVHNLESANVGGGGRMYSVRPRDDLISSTVGIFNNVVYIYINGHVPRHTPCGHRYARTRLRNILRRGMTQRRPKRSNQIRPEE